MATEISTPTVEITSYVRELGSSEDFKPPLDPNIGEIEISSHLLPIDSYADTERIEQITVELESHVSKIKSRVRTYFDREPISEDRLISSHIEAIKSYIKTDEHGKYVPVYLTTMLVENPTNVYHKDNTSNVEVIRYDV